MEERKQTVGQLIRSIRRLRAPGVLMLRDNPLRAPGHVWAQPGQESKATVSRDAIRQMDWQHRQGARGAMRLRESIGQVPVTDALQGQWQPGAALLLEVQGQADLTMAERQAAKLGRKMAAKGLVSDSTIQDGVSDGVFALTAWRNQITVQSGAEAAPGLVCWQAVQQSMSRDTYGDTVPLADFSLEQLASSALPLPQLVGDDSRQDKAARLIFARARARRPALLPGRIAALKAQGGRGKRQDTIDRIGRACLLMAEP